MLIAYHRRELALDEQQRLEAHLSACAGCRCELLHVRRAYHEMAALPVYPVPDNLSAMAEEARRRSQPVSLWRRYFPLPLTAGVLLLLFVLIFCHPLQQPGHHASIAALPAHHADHTAKLEMAMIPDTHHALRTRADRRQRILSSPPPHSVPREVGKNYQQHSRRQDAPMRAAIASPRATFDDGRNQVMGQSMLMRHVDVLAQYMAQAAHTPAPVTCAVFPVVTDCESDYPVADTLTATLQYELRRKMPQATISHQAPLLSFPQFAVGIGPDTPEVMRIATAGSSDFVITGSVAKSKAGYLFSVYVVDVRSNKLLVNGAHPLLLPGELLASSHSNADSPSIIPLAPSDNSPAGET